MIALGWRLLRNAGRETVLRLVATVVGVTAGVGLLLFAAAAYPALHAHDQRPAWLATGSEPAQPARQPGRTDPMLWRTRHSHYRGAELTWVEVAPLGPRPQLPPGLAGYPGPGRMLVSPALAAALDQYPAGELADRFGASPAGRLPDAALTYPGQLLAVVGRTPAQLDGQPGVDRAAALETAPLPHTVTRFLQFAITVGAVGLILPVVVFVASATRLGAARREQRFAALRLVGATPRQTATVAVVDAAVPTLAGAVAGIALFWAVRPLAARIPFDGHPFFTADFTPAPAAAAAVAVGIPALVLAATLLSLRRLRLGPLGVIRRSAPVRVHPVRVLPLLAALGAFAAVVAALTAGGRVGAVGFAALAVSFAGVIVGLALAGPWLTGRVAGLLAGRARRAPTLMAARRIADNPTASYRAVGGVVLAVFVGSVFSTITPAVLDGARAGAPGRIRPNVLLTGTNQASPSAVDGLVAGLGRQPGVTAVVALRSADTSGRLLGGGKRGGGPGTVIGSCQQLRRVVAVTPPSCPGPGGRTVIPEAQRSDLPPDVGTLLEPDRLAPADLARHPVLYLAVGTTDPAAAERARTMIELALPAGDEPTTGVERATLRTRQLRLLQRMVYVGMALALAVGGASLAIATAGAVLERRRPYAVLRLTGIRLTDLHRTVLTEAAAPLTVTTVVSVLTGLAVGDILAAAAAAPLRWPSVSFPLVLAAGLAAALGLTAATLPLLDRVTEPAEAARYE